MASGIFAVLDDIAALMDDVAVATKVATRKTAAILGDDLAVNAEKATGFVSSRELPVLWAISKGSLMNKVIIVPVALLLNSFFSVAVTVILILGGIFLAYEGAEKILAYLFRKNKKDAPKVATILPEGPETEKAKIKSAITTDFILSIEIVIIALGTVTDQSLTLQILTVSAVALIATVGVYGLVALIVRLDDIGLKLIHRNPGRRLLPWIGQRLVSALPYIIRSLSVIGTIALLLVAGGIMAHNIDFFHDLWSSWPALLKELLIGFLIGTVATIVIGLFTKIYAFFLDAS